MRLDKRTSERIPERNLNADERIGSLFQPDTLLGHQYFDNLRCKTLLEPEKSLMLAVLEDGVRSFQENLLAQSGKKRLLFEEAQKWLWSDDSAWPFSFVSICAHLGFDPGYIRRGLRNWLEQKQTLAVDEKPKSIPAPKRRAA
jgi:hypothetical protein